MHCPVDKFYCDKFFFNTLSRGRFYRRFRHVSLRTAALLFAVLLSGCATFAPTPPSDQSNICEIFREQPSWYDYARDSQARWGTPIATQMSFIQQESSFRSHIRPDRKYYLGFIPGPRPSSAKGYAQAQDPVWDEYRAQAGSLFARRTHMKHATDFIGWYNARTHAQTGIPLTNPEHLYLAYHEGAGGYQRGTYRGKPAVMRSAAQVASRAGRYQAQLNSCEAEFQCRHFYQIWPFCRA
ncbi:lysozyme-like domain containing protein [Halomonas dongshanensis]|uniref:Lysozyme-like domain containing protein n=1 Tax=Halomonas dongshanensis TaxID=2890835 RepID=A0ABT2EFT5_9GAMM|nr:lysozyme-like domain containing protein [Halomonas dongshanensis]MCS2610456.1 lysozyme-like domain containing protein [Halomonas dongshanensis]